MEIKDYTTEELKVELKRRAEIAKSKKEEKMKMALRCMNCKHCVQNPKVPSWCRGHYMICEVRTFGKKTVRHYSVRLSDKSCEKFERNED